MKKLLVVLFAVIMVLSVVSISLAAPTVKGSFRYEFIANSSQADQTALVDNPDLRVIIDNNTAKDPVSGHLQIRAKADGSTSNAAVSDFLADEYWLKFNTAIGMLTIGNWDWKITPSRVNLKASGNNIFPRSQSTLALDHSFDGGLYAGLAYVIDGSSDAKVLDGAYDVKLGYKADVFGVEAHSYDTKSAAGLTGVALDAYYQVLDNIKVYTYYHDQKATAADPDGDTVVGGQFQNLGGIKGCQVSVEYSLLEQPTKYNNYFLTAVYPVGNGFQFELEFNNISKDDTKTLLRARYDF